MAENVLHEFTWRAESGVESRPCRVIERDGVPVGQVTIDGEWTDCECEFAVELASVAVRATKLEKEAASCAAEWLCESCNVVHPPQPPRPGRVVFQSCSDCGKAMTPTSPNRRRIAELEAKNAKSYADGVRSGAGQVIDTLCWAINNGTRFDLIAQRIADAKANPFAFSLSYKRPGAV